MLKATVTEIVAGLRQKKFSSQEITKDYLVAIKKDKLNCFISVNDEALESARLADEQIATGDYPNLTGVPLAVKDLFTTEGLRTTAGSKMLDTYVPAYTATAVERLQKAGMIVIGKTNCDEFAMGSSNENSAYGPVKNPHDPSRVPGGSSGGSAAAVAAGLAPAALGTDTGGSVRLPASFCGVVGLKPTYGRISRSGMIAMASSLDHVGTLTRSVADAALLLQTMAGKDPLDATSSIVSTEDYARAASEPVKKLTIGIPKEYFVGLADDDLQALLEKILGSYKKLQHVTFVDISLPHTQYGLAVYYIIMPSEVSANMARYDGLRFGARQDKGDSFADWFAHNRSALGPEVRRRIMLGSYSLSVGYFDAYYHQAAKVRSLIRKDFEDAFKKVDCILAPTAPTPAFKLGEKYADPLTMYLSDIFTVSANLAGIPALAYPVGEVRDLPVGLQLMGPWFSEGLLFRAAQHLMSASENN